jgi:hypothetical protein
MRAFEVSLNGEMLCAAGIGDDGVLTAIISWVAGDHGAEPSLHVGGRVSPMQEHVTWTERPLAIGDEVVVKVADLESVALPNKRHLRDPKRDLEAKKKYVKTMAKELGWTVGVTKTSESVRGKKK